MKTNPNLCEKDIVGVGNKIVLFYPDQQCHSTCFDYVSIQFRSQTY